MMGYYGIESWKDEYIRRMVILLDEFYERSTTDAEYVMEWARRALALRFEFKAKQLEEHQRPRGIDEGGLGF